MPIARLKTRSVSDTIVGADDDADFDGIINELNAHTAAASPHADHVITTGDTMTGELAINITGTGTCADLDSAATTDDIFEIDGNSLTTGRLADIVSNSSSTGTRDLVRIMNDDTAATGVTGLRIVNDAVSVSLLIGDNT